MTRVGAHGADTPADLATRFALQLLATLGLQLLIVTPLLTTEEFHERRAVGPTGDEPIVDDIGGHPAEGAPSLGRRLGGLRICGG